MTIAIMVFVVLASIYYHFFPLTAIMLIALALLDDVPIMTIALCYCAASAGEMGVRPGAGPFVSTRVTRSDSELRSALPR